MLELSRGIRLAVDIRNCLELERALERNRIMQAAAEEKRVLLFRKLLGPGDDHRLERQYRLDRARQMTQVAQPARLVFRGQPAARLGKSKREQEQRRQLRGKGLGGGDADLGAGAREIRQLGLPYDRAGGDVAYREGMPVTESFRMRQRGKRVGGFARLRDPDHQRFGGGDAVAGAAPAGGLPL